MSGYHPTFDAELEHFITEAMLGDKTSEALLRQRFNIPPSKSIRQYFEEIVTGEPDDPFTRSRR